MLFIAIVNSSPIHSLPPSLLRRNFPRCFCRSVPTRLIFITVVAMRTEHQNTKESEKAKTTDAMNRVTEAYKLQTELVSFYAWRNLAADKTKPI